MKKASTLRRLTTRIGVIVVLLLVGVVSFALWFATLPRAGYNTPNLAVAAKLPGYLFQVRALGNGIHFQVVAATYQRDSGMQLGRAMHLGFDRPNGGYRGDHDGYLASGLGFIAAWLPHTFNGGDYIQSPFAAVVVPYWFLIVGSAAGLAIACGVAGRLVDWLRRASWPAWYGAGVVLFLFFLANLVPFRVWSPGRGHHPSTPWGWVGITLFPGWMHDEVALKSGFPLECSRRAYIGGRRVTQFHGASLGFYQNRAMENLCFALLAAAATMLVVDKVRGRITARTAAKVPPLEKPKMAGWNNPP